MVAQMKDKRNVLFVDDETSIVNSLRLVFRRDKSIRTYTTTSQAEALNLIEQEHFHVVVSDMRMPGMNGAELLSKIKRKSPNTLRMLLTGYSEMDNILSSINQGEVYRFLEKPWVNHDLMNKVLKAADISENLWDSNKENSTPSLDSVGTQNVVDTSGDIAKSQAILFIGHNDNDVLRVLEKQAGVSVFSATNAQKAMALLLKQEEISVIVVNIDAKYRELNSYSHFTDSASLLKTLKTIFPAVTSIVISDEKDSKAAIGLVNQAQIFRYLTPPLSEEKIIEDAQAALQYAKVMQLDPAYSQRHEVEEMDLEEKDSFMEKIDVSLFGKLKNRFSNFFSFGNS